MSMNKTYIAPSQGWRSLRLQELWEYRDLFLILTEREIKLRYKQTILGILWVILQPLLIALLFSAVFGKWGKFPTGGSPYFLFVFSGMLPWMLCSQAVLRASSSLLTDSRIISKVYFPRLLITASACSAVIIDFFVSLVVMAVLLFAYQIPLTVNLLFLPVIVCLIMLFSFGIGSFFGGLNVYYRDFAHAFPFFLQIWMYASPVIYSSELISRKWFFLYHLNPLAGFIEAFRWAILGNIPFPADAVLEAVIVIVLTSFMGLLIFKRIERRFADVI